MSSPSDKKRTLCQAQRIVIKIGSGVLVQNTGRPDLRHIRHLTRQMARLRRAGREVLLVSSGAIAAGMEALHLRRRPGDLPNLQMAAAVGQVRLMTAYDRFFSLEGCRVGQVLLTHDDLKNRTRHLNARNTIMQLLRQGIIPIINENDVVAVDEIKFGDNDILAALVTILIEADLLLLLTTSDGLWMPGGGVQAHRIPYLKAVTRETLALASGKGNEFSVGGMASKLQAAQTAVEVGGRVIIADGREKDIIARVLAGEEVGTLIGDFKPGRRTAINGRKRWIAFFHKPMGTLFVDDGARRALEQNGHSLLPIGIREIDGHFGKGAVVDVRALDGKLIARGLVDYSSERIQKIKGHRTSEINEILGCKDYDEVIHRDNMVMMHNKHGEVL